MTVAEAALLFRVNRKTILAICNDPALSATWGCVLCNGEWQINTPPAGDRWYTVARVSQIMDKSRVHVFRWCRSGTIKSVRVGRNYRIPKSEVLKLFSIRD